MRAIIVSRKHLNMVGKKIILESEIKSNLDPIPENIYGNTLEAIIGVIYLDKGIQHAIIFIKKHIYNSEFVKKISDTDFKSKLLKYTQKEKVDIKFNIEIQKGLDHHKEFLVAIFLNGIKISQAQAKSKKEAEQKAAKKAIQNLV